MSQEQKGDINSRPAAPVRSFTPGLPDSSNDFLREQVQKQQRSNFHSTSLNKSVTMVANSVNKTALHPGGVEYVIPPSDLDVWGSLLRMTDGLIQASAGAHRAGGGTSREGSH